MSVILMAPSELSGTWSVRASMCDSKETSEGWCECDDRGENDCTGDPSAVLCSSGRLGVLYWARCLLEVEALE